MISKDLIFAIIKTAFHYNIINGQLSASAQYDITVQKEGFLIQWPIDHISCISPSGPNGERYTESDTIYNSLFIYNLELESKPLEKGILSIQEYVDEAAIEIQFYHLKLN